MSFELPILWQLAIGSAIAVGLMTTMWLIQLRTKNAGIVDVAWGAGIGVVGSFFALTSSGDASRKVLLATLIALWAIRLTSYLFLRVVGHAEEGRYATLRTTWGAAANRRLFWFFQLQAATVVLFAWPVMLAAQSEWPLFAASDYIAIAIWILGVGGVALSDAQLAAFKRTTTDRRAVCNVGLWRYSRHPNYFFEWLHWWSYLLLALGNPWWLLAAITPLLLLYFLLYVTGIPPTEAQAIASRGDAYRAYQRTTSPFIPWLPKRDSQ
jgi:steroid 5-alpha reductase family enzyme